MGAVYQVAGRTKEEVVVVGHLELTEGAEGAEEVEDPKKTAMKVEVEAVEAAVEHRMRTGAEEEEEAEAEDCEVNSMHRQDSEVAWV